jgi:hypothetical protein
MNMSLSAAMREILEHNPDSSADCYRENNSEFRRFGHFAAILASGQSANSMACKRIPYAREQGIF